MLKFDFNTYMDKFIDKNKYNELLEKKELIYNKFINNEMADWFTKKVEDDVVNRVKQVGTKIKGNSDVLLVIAIGGSFMGGFAVSEVLNNKYVKKDTEVIYIGNNLSSIDIEELLDYIKDKRITINVISKSGTTFEIKTIYNYIKDYMLSKYSMEEFKDRVIMTTNNHDGYLKEEADKYGFERFIIPDGVGGRFCIATPAHLLPMLVNGVDIDKFLKGYYSGKDYYDDAYKYSVIRTMMYDNGKYAENFSVYEPKIYYYTEYIKQEFAESEGKDGKGLLPMSTVNSRDLHSLGQFLQDGNKIVFETVIKADMGNNDNLKMANDIIRNSVVEAHYQGGVPNIIIDIGKINEKKLGEITMFFMMAAVCSAYIFDVNPFNQPGVESYKSIMREKLN